MAVGFFARSILTLDPVRSDDGGGSGMIGDGGRKEK